MRVPEERYFDNTPQGAIAQMLPLLLLARRPPHHLHQFTARPSSFDVWDLPTESREPRPIIQTPFDEYQGVLSPDGRWLAYVSEESGSPQVYVQSFPDGAQRVQISSRGGTEPQWRRDGQELYFLRADRMLMAAAVVPAAAFKTAEPVALFLTRVPLLGNPYRQHIRGVGRRQALSRQQRRLSRPHRLPFTSCSTGARCCRRARTDILSGCVS